MSNHNRFGIVIYCAHNISLLYSYSYFLVRKKRAKYFMSNNPFDMAVCKVLPKCNFLPSLFAILYAFQNLLQKSSMDLFLCENSSSLSSNPAFSHYVHTYIHKYIHSFKTTFNWWCFVAKCTSVMQYFWVTSVKRLELCTDGMKWTWIWLSVHFRWTRKALIWQ